MTLYRALVFSNGLENMTGFAIPMELRKNLFLGMYLEPFLVRRGFATACNGTVCIRADTLNITNGLLIFAQNWICQSKLISSGFCSGGLLSKLELKT
jgi:hypothetical protein